MKKQSLPFARSYGSGGRTLGKLLAEQLGINCYDREILRMASDASGINEGTFGQADERLEAVSVVWNFEEKSVQGVV